MQSPPTPDAERAAQAALYRSLGFRPDGLVDLSALAMPPQAVEARRESLNCSELPTLASGDAKAINQLYEIKLGERAPDDLSGDLNVQAGTFMEPFILARLEFEFGVQVSRRGERVHNPRRPWLKGTLDGFCEYKGAKWAVQTKFFSPFFKLADACAAKAAQVMGECYASDADGTLLVIYNQGDRLHVFEFERDPVALSELLSRCDEFWEAVQAKRLPRPMPKLEKVAKPKPALRIGELDMTGSNAFADAAARWLGTREAAATFDAAAKDLKGLMPEDVARVFGHGVQVKASKSGAKSISPLVEDAAEQAPE